MVPFLLAESLMYKVYDLLFIDVSENKQYACDNRNDDGDEIFVRLYLRTDIGRPNHSGSTCKSYDDEEQNRFDWSESGDIHKNIFGNAGYEEQEEYCCFKFWTIDQDAEFFKFLLGNQFLNKRKTKKLHTCKNNDIPDRYANCRIDCAQESSEYISSRDLYRFSRYDCNHHLKHLEKHKYHSAPRAE